MYYIWVSSVYNAYIPIWLHVVLYLITYNILYHTSLSSTDLIKLTNYFNHWSSLWSTTTSRWSSVFDPRLRKPLLLLPPANVSIVDWLMFSFFRYCKQVLDKEIDANCTSLLQTLVKFQDRLYHKDPIKAKTKRRLVLGLREVTKHLKLRRVKLVIISPNLEKIQSKGKITWSMMLNSMHKDISVLYL